MQWCFDRTSTSLRLIAAEGDERNDVTRLIAAFRDCRLSAARTRADELLRAFNGNEISANEFESLARWSVTSFDEAYAAGREAAERLTIALFGLSPPRRGSHETAAQWLERFCALAGINECFP